ncbi:MAG TPA: SDR family oxidoreductase [Actinomycetota bacterium]|jgi:NAD(P)-dependent dehydrogenase (short-subunit alcohol dehydrogenase family)|nr:SDR family oxidoreductase [Actinomycetota bacterium]
MRLSDKVCVVTGASSGIGRRTALELAAAGATVCAAARREQQLQSLVGECGGGRHSYVVTDVSQRDQVHRLAAHVQRTYGRCDVLVNNAGFSGHHRPLEDADAVSELEAIVATNFLGAVYCTSELLELLEAAAPSSVVNVGSMAGRIAVTGSAAYSASKFALMGWSEALHYELAPKGVYVSVIAPGLIPTEGFPQSDFLRDPLLRHVLGTEEQVAAAILQTVESRKLERTVPRWNYLLQIPRVLTPPLYRFALQKLTARYPRHGVDV